MGWISGQCVTNPNQYEQDADTAVASLQERGRVAEAGVLRDQVDGFLRGDHDHHGWATVRRIITGEQ